jgi:hypothetical protein
MTSPDSRVTSKVHNNGVQKLPRKGTRSCLECRRRKLRCIYSQEGSICHECLARGVRCIGQGTSDRDIFAEKKKPIETRVERLERLMEQFLEEQIGHNETTIYSSPIHIQSTLKSDDAGLFPLRTSARAPISSLIGNAVFSSSEENERTAAESSPFSPDLDVRRSCPDRDATKARETLSASLANVFVTKDVKDETVTKTLVSALPGEEKVQEALEKQQSWWSRIGRMYQGENTTENEADLKHFFRDAISKVNPTSVARVVQLIASEVEESECEKLLLLVDKLIIGDDEYMNTMGGLNCALWQNRLLMDTGQARRAW